MDNAPQHESSIEDKFKEAKGVIQEWVDKQGHDRCWYYPDLFTKLAEIFDIHPSKEPSLPPLDEFKRGCERYQKEEYKLNLPEQQWEGEGGAVNPYD